MKKLLGIALTTLALAACSSSNDRPEPPHDAVAQGEMNQAPMPQQGAQGGNPQVEEALKACQQSVGASQDQVKFDACMKEKGFVKPDQQPAPQAVQAQENPQAKTVSNSKTKKVKSTKK